MHRSRTRVAGTLVIGLATLLATVMAAGIAAAAEPDARVVTVSGRAEERAAPDRATVTLGVSAHATTLEAARSAVNRVIPTLLALTHDLGIADAQVRSTRISVQPDFDRGALHRDLRVVGYGVQRQLIVELRDVDRLGELLEKSVSAGANVVGEPALDSSRRADIERTALAHAVEDARQNAQALATALGASVGPPRRVTMNPSGRMYAGVPRTRIANVIASAASNEAPETYQPGELTFSAEVEVTFDLVPAAPAR